GAERGWKGSPRATASGVWGRSPTCRRASEAQRASPPERSGDGRGPRERRRRGSGGEAPRSKLEAPPGFEPGVEVLQTSALPLGDGALRDGSRGCPQANEPSE